MGEGGGRERGRPARPRSGGGKGPGEAGPGAGPCLRLGREVRGGEITMNRESARILVVDDEADVRDIMRLVLTREGYEVVASPSGEEALAAFEVSRPDLLLLDVMMPGIDGYEVCRRIKGDPRWASTPVIMVTAKMDLQDVVSGLEFGADDYVTKPFFFEELLARVRAALRASAAERALAKKHRTLDALYSLTRAATQSLELDTVLRETLSQTAAALGMNAGLIHLIDVTTGEMTLAATQGLEAEWVSRFGSVSIGSYPRKAVEAGELSIVPDLAADPGTRDLELTQAGFRGVGMIALSVPGRVIGALSVVSRPVWNLEREEVDFLRAIGRQVGVAIEHARLFEA